MVGVQAKREKLLLQRRMNAQKHLFRGSGLGLQARAGCYHDRLK